jgi:hypothetical protein
MLLAGGRKATDERGLLLVCFARREHAALDRPLVDPNVNGLESEDAGPPVLLNPFLSY